MTGFFFRLFWESKPQASIRNKQIGVFNYLCVVGDDAGNLGLKKVPYVRNWLFTGCFPVGCRFKCKNVPCRFSNYTIAKV